MKFKVGDKVKITSGKDKGREGVISRVLPKEDKVVVEGINMYVKHSKPQPMVDRPGEKQVLERPLPTAKIAILNDQDQVDRIGYSVDEQGNKTRVFKKTGSVVPEPEPKEEVEEILPNKPSNK